LGDTVLDPDPHHFVNLDPHPHEKNQDSDPYPDPHQSDMLDPQPDRDPHQFAVDKPKRME
jgi:hypothetical protein